MATKRFDDRLEGRLQADLVAAARASGCEILEAAFAGNRLRIVVEHPEATTLTHCEEISKRISAILDVEDFGDRKYVLEVGSPGLDRKLYESADYHRFAGRLARVTWMDPERRRRTDVGRLDRIEETATPAIRLSLREGGSLDIPLHDVTEARLEIEL